MKCPLCQTEMRITQTEYRTENDTSDKKTRLYAIQPVVCRNKHCENYNQIVDEIKHELALKEFNNETEYTENVE